MSILYMNISYYSHYYISVILHINKFKIWNSIIIGELQRNIYVYFLSYIILNFFFNNMNIFFCLSESILKCVVNSLNSILFFFKNWSILFYIYRLNIFILCVLLFIVIILFRIIQIYLSLLILLLLSLFNNFIFFV